MCDNVSQEKAARCLRKYWHGSCFIKGKENNMFYKNKQ